MQLLSVSALAMRTNLTWHVDVAPEVRSCVVGMPQTELMQIIMNLGTNSVRAAGARPSVAIKIVLLGKKDGFAEISLRDDGGGLTAEMFERLTVRGKAVRGQINVRQGLGLRLVCRLIEQYGGDLKVAEDSGLNGTHMIVKLPCLD